MRNILVLIKNNFKIDVLENPFGFLVSLFAPILILFIVLKIISGNSGYLNIGIVDNDSSQTTKVIIESLKNQDGYNVNDINQDNIDNLFSEKAIDVAIVFNKGFENNIIINGKDEINVTSVENDGVGDLLKGLLNREMLNIRDISLASNKDKEVYYKGLINYSNSTSVNITKESLNDLYKEYSSSQMFIGFLIMFMLIRGMRTAYRIFDEKRENIYMRIFMAPVKSSEYYLAGIISGYISILIQVVLGIVSINILNVETGLSNIQLFIILALVGLVSISLALCCSAFASNRTEASNIFNFANMFFLMVGGAFVPLEIIPPIMEKISYFTPVRWAMESISDIQQGAQFSEVYKYLFIIILFAVTFFVIGAYKTAKEEKKILIN